MPTFKVSLTADVSISATAEVDAKDEASALEAANALHASGRLRWAFRGAPVGVFRGPVVPGRAWAVPVASPETETVTVPSALSAVDGDPISVTSIITSLAGVPDGGTAEFFVDGVSVGSSAVTDGASTLAGLFLAHGARILRTEYSGYQSFLSSKSKNVTVTMHAAQQAVVVTSALFGDSDEIDQMPFGNTLIVRGTVASAGTGTPDGTVTVSAQVGLNPPIELGTAELDGSGNFSLDATDAFLPPVYTQQFNVPLPQSYTISVHYPGGTGFDAGDSDPDFLTVTYGTVSMVQDPMSPASGAHGTVTLRCVLTPQPNPAAPMTGKVAFTDSGHGVIASNISVVSGVAQTTFISVAGAYSVTASYAGDSNYFDPQQSNAVTANYS